MGKRYPNYEVCTPEMKRVASVISNFNLVANSYIKYFTCPLPHIHITSCKFTINLITVKIPDNSITPSTHIWTINIITIPTSPCALFVYLFIYYSIVIDFIILMRLYQTPCIMCCPSISQHGDFILFVSISSLHVLSVQIYMQYDLCSNCLLLYLTFVNPVVSISNITTGALSWHFYLPAL